MTEHDHDRFVDLRVPDDLPTFGRKIMSGLCLLSEAALVLCLVTLLAVWLAG